MELKHRTCASDGDCLFVVDDASMFACAFASKTLYALCEEISSVYAKVSA